MAWDNINPQVLTGWGTAGPGGQSGAAGSQPEGSGLSNAVTSANGAAPPLWSPDNPLFWFGLILAATAGLLTVSTTFNAGPVKGKVSA